MERRRMRDEADARSCIAALGESGMSTAAWCRSQGVDGRSIRAWTINVERGAGRAGKPKAANRVQLIELVPVSPPRGPARYVVRVGRRSSSTTSSPSPHCNVTDQRRRDASKPPARNAVRVRDLRSLRAIVDAA